MPGKSQSTGNTVTFHTNGRNLHINLGRDPDTRDLRALSVLAHCHCDEGGRLFLDVRHLARVEEGTVDGLRALVRASGLPPQSVYYKGQLGFSLAQDGNRVLIVRPRDGRAAPRPGETPGPRFARRPPFARAKNEAAPSNASSREGGCGCGGACGPNCCRVTGGPCCGGHKS